MRPRWEIIHSFEEFDIVEPMPSQALAMQRARLGVKDGAHVQVIDPEGILFYDSEED